MKPWNHDCLNKISCYFPQLLSIWVCGVSAFGTTFKIYPFLFLFFFSNFPLIYGNDRGHISYLWWEDIQIQCQDHVSRFSEKFFLKIHLPNCPDSSAVSPTVELLVVWAAVALAKCYGVTTIPSPLPPCSTWGNEGQQKSWKWGSEVYLEMKQGGDRKKVFLVWTLFPTIIISF